MNKRKRIENDPDTVPGGPNVTHGTDGAIKQSPPSREAEDSECFVCGGDGELIICEHSGCASVYHHACVFERRPPSLTSDATWFCPRHFCAVCGQREGALLVPPPTPSFWRCRSCTLSFCAAHMPRRLLKTHSGSNVRRARRSRGGSRRAAASDEVVAVTGSFQCEHCRRPRAALLLARVLENVWRRIASNHLALPFFHPLLPLIGDEPSTQHGRSCIVGSSAGAGDRGGGGGGGGSDGGDGGSNNTALCLRSLIARVRALEFKTASAFAREVQTLAQQAQRKCWAQCSLHGQCIADGNQPRRQVSAAAQVVCEAAHTIALLCREELLKPKTAAKVATIEQAIERELTQAKRRQRRRTLKRERAAQRAKVKAVLNARARALALAQAKVQQAQERAQEEDGATMERRKETDDSDGHSDGDSENDSSSDNGMTTSNTDTDSDLDTSSDSDGDRRMNTTTRVDASAPPPCCRTVTSRRRQHRTEHVQWRHELSPTYAASWKAGYDPLPALTHGEESEVPPRTLRQWASYVRQAPVQMRPGGRADVAAGKAEAATAAAAAAGGMVGDKGDVVERENEAMEDEDMAAEGQPEAPPCDLEVDALHTADAAKLAEQSATLQQLMRLNRETQARCEWVMSTMATGRCHVQSASEIVRWASSHKPQPPQRTAQQQRAETAAMQRRAEAKGDEQGEKQEQLTSAATLLEHNHALRSALNKANEDARQLRAACAVLRQKMNSSCDTCQPHKASAPAEVHAMPALRARSKAKIRHELHLRAAQ